jgi:DnaJ-class molecular chaperone
MGDHSFSPGPMLRECPECEGHGTVDTTFPGQDTYPMVSVEIACPECDGAGQVMLSAHCPNCYSTEVEQAVEGIHETPRYNAAHCHDCGEDFAHQDAVWA